MGMSFQLITSVQSIAAIWISTKTPRFGILIARREFSRLDAEWRKAALLSVLMMLLGGASLLGVLYLMTGMRLEFVNRVLSPIAFLLLGVGSLFSLGAQCIALYLRAHKKEVLTTVGIVSGLSMGLLVWQLGAQFGPLGASGGYLFVMSCVAFPMAFLVWHRARHSMQFRESTR
jgi:O-antigen/teichoic acid export membrane protein